MPGPARTALEASIRANKPGFFASLEILEAVPFIFDGDRRACVEWKSRLAEALGVNSHSVIVVGSAVAGFSLSPTKAFSVYNAESDVDVAVVSAHYFDIGWRWLRTLGAERYRLPSHVQRWIEDHRTRLVYYGTIATDKLLPYMPFGPTWVTKTASIISDPPISGRDLNIRLYRDNESLADYQTHGIRKLRERLLAAPGTTE